MTKCYVVHRRDKNNVGDMASNPLQYFMDSNEYITVDIVDIGKHNFDPNVPVIAGGGGLLANEFMNEALRDLTVSPDKNSILNIGQELWSQTAPANTNIRDEFFAKLNPLISEYVNKLSNDKSPRIIWGAGHNGNFEKKFKGSLEYPAWLRNFDLVGVRDYGQEHKWVPCASCMHPALREKHIIKHPVIWFEHKKQLIKSTDFGLTPIPRFVNSGDNITETIRLLGSADVIVTNSYHGAYWGTLLGRKVIVIEAWSSKFNAMKHKPYFLSKGDYWKDYLNQIPVYNNALEECISATEEYWNKVKEYL
jgi:hypothetical protein